MALNLKQKLLGAYFLVEEQYYNVVDALENAGRYEFTDYFVNPIEERGIPSFVVALLILLLLLTGVFFLFLRPQPTSAGFEVRVYNAYTNEKIDGFITITSNGETLAATKTQDARAYYDELPRTQIDVSVESEGFEKYEKSVDATKTRFFIARLKPLRGVNAGGFMLQQITEPPDDWELPPMPAFEPTPWQPEGEASPTPTNETPSPSPSVNASPSPSAQASATPTPLNETYVLLAEGNRTSFAGFMIHLSDIGGSVILINLLNASTNNTIWNDTIIIVNYSVSYANLEIWFLGTVNDSGVTKARLLLKAFALVPSPSASPPPFFFINITAPQANEVIYDAFARIEGFARVNAGEGITAVEVSIDGGAHWIAASGTNNWNWSWATPAEGVFEIRARARTSSGRTAA
ncbi:MAG: Ig-like domain-containing protein, partial [Candidatus Micrarchaeota archaeon]